MIYKNLSPPHGTHFTDNFLTILNKVFGASKGSVKIFAKYLTPFPQTRLYYSLLLSMQKLELLPVCNFWIKNVITSFYPIKTSV